MSPRIDSEQRLTPSQPSKRRLLGMGAGIAAGLVLFGTVEQPTPVQAQASTWPFNSDKNWFPLRKIFGLITLHEPDGPIYRFDREYGTNLQKEYADYATWSLEKSPLALKIKNKEVEDDRDTWGYCYAAAIADYETGRLRATGEIGPENAARIYADPMNRAVLAAFCAGYVYNRPSWEANKVQENNDHFKRNLIENHDAYVADANIGKTGNWFHVVSAYEESTDMVEIEGFGERRWIPSSHIRASFQPEPIETAIANNRNSRLIKETGSLRYADLNRQRVFEFTGLAR